MTFNRYRANGILNRVKIIHQGPVNDKRHYGNDNMKLHRLLQLSWMTSGGGKAMYAFARI